MVHHQGLGPIKKKVLLEDKRKDNDVKKQAGRAGKI